MRFDILTLFPGYVDNVLSESIIGRARNSRLFEIYCHNIRDWSTDKNRRVDDTPYGGGKGMLMAAPPVYDCCTDVRKMSEITPVRVICTSPRGRLLTQEDVFRYSSEYNRLIIICGHYEGIDQRAVDAAADEEISVGDYVLTGGELPACLLVDAVARTIPGVLSDDECFIRESHSDGLLEYPQYTRPYDFMGVTVPDVLLSGNHAQIDDWRRMRSLDDTRERRPDLYDRYVENHPQEQKSVNKGGRRKQKT